MLNERSSYVLDSYPIAVYDNYRIGRCKLYQGEEWLASSASDGRSGLRAKAPTTLGMLKGLLRELWLRLTGKLPPDRLTIREVPRYP